MTMLARRPWPEFQELDAALTAYLADITDKIIREEVFGDASDADEVAEPLKLPLIPSWRVAIKIT